MGEASRVKLPAHPFRAVAVRQPWLPEFVAALEREPADLIHATNLGLEGLALNALRLARRRDVPFVITPFVHLGGPRDRVARRYVTMPHQRELLRDADAVLTMTEREADFIASTGVRTSKIHVVGAGVNPAEVTGGGAARFRQRHNLQGVLVGSIGALAEEKGTFDLVRAIQRLRQRGHSVELVVAGPALQQFERWYTALEEREKTGIRLLGIIDAEQKRDLLAAIDIFALPSRTESFGIVYLEAWMNQKPVVAADSGAVPELVRDGVTGLLVPFGDIEAIADAIVRLSADEALRDRLGTEGSTVVHTEYTWDLVFERVRAAYRTLLGTAMNSGVVT